MAAECDLAKPVGKDVAGSRPRAVGIARPARALHLFQGHDLGWGGSSCAAATKARRCSMRTNAGPLACAAAANPCRGHGAQLEPRSVAISSIASVASNSTRVCSCCHWSISCRGRSAHEGDDRRDRAGIEPGRPGVAHPAWRQQRPRGVHRMQLLAGRLPLLAGAAR